MPRQTPTRRQKGASSQLSFRHLTESLRETQREVESANFGEKYVLGENEEVDAMHEQRWAALLAAAPEFVPITDDIPAEYLEQIEHDNAVYEKIRERVEDEREQLTWRQEKKPRKR